MVWCILKISVVNGRKSSSSLMINALGSLSVVETRGDLEPDLNLLSWRKDYDSTDMGVFTIQVIR